MSASDFRKGVRSLYSSSGLRSWPKGWEDRGLRVNRAMAYEAISAPEGDLIQLFAQMFYRDPVGRRLVEARAQRLMKDHAREFNTTVREIFDRAASGDIREAEVPEHAG